MSGIEGLYLDMMPSTVQVAAWTAYDSYGRPSYAADVAYRARIVDKRRLLRDNAGVQRLAVATIYLFSANRIDPRSRITLPDGTQPTILAAESFPDQDGDHHTVLYVGEATAAGDSTAS